MTLPGTSAKGARGETTHLFVALAVALLVVTGAAWAATGALTPRGCIADETNNAGGCPETTPGLKDTQFITVSGDGEDVYAGGYADNAIVHFRRNTTTGALAAQSCVGDAGNNPDACAQAANGLIAPAWIELSDDGKSAYVASDESNNSSAAWFRRNRTTGALQPKGCIADPDTNPDGCATTAEGLNGGTTAIASSRDGKSVYIVSGNDDSIVRFKRNTATGELTPKGCISDTSASVGCAKTTKGLTEPHAVEVSRDGRSVYATGTQDNAIVRFERNPKTGALTPRGCIGDEAINPDGCARTAAGLDGSRAVVISADGRSLYATGNDADAIVRFKRNRRTGALMPKGCIADPDSNPAGCEVTAQGMEIPGSPTLSSDSKSLYLTGLLDDAVLRFKRNRSTGALTPKGCVGDIDTNAAGCGQTAQGLGDVYGLAVSADGKSVYTASVGDDAIVSFRRQR